MNTVNYDWVRAQFAAAKVRQHEGDAVLELLKKWEEMDVPAEAVSGALQIFKSVAQSHALVPETGDTWVQAQVGFIQKGDVVRVRHDAFEGELGLAHNGRVGYVIDLRYGDVIFRSTDDKEPFLDGTHYPPLKLEKRIKKR